MKLVLIFLVLIVCAFAHKHHPTGDAKHDDNNKSKPYSHDANNAICHYTSTKGVDYDLRLLEHKALVDYQYFDETTRSTFYFRPCGTVKTAGCDPSSSVCMINSAGKAVSFGSRTMVQWADGAENDASIEATYGNGEPCNDGIPRKTIVEYKCALTSAKSGIVSAEFDECYAKFVLESPYVCPAANYCATIQTMDLCQSQEGLCNWAKGKCESAAGGCLGWRHITHASAFFAIMLITCMGGLIACTLGLCLCACRSRRMRRSRIARRAARKAAKKVTPKKHSKKQQIAPEYQPVPQMPYQLVPGGFAPINPYNFQGYPMVTFVPAQEQTEQV